MELEVIIGLETHIQLKTKSKMFCSCSNAGEFAPPNTTICPICVGHPGTLPVPNKQAIIWSIKAAKALGCRINPISKFDRKHYFYPDLPKGYQISQYDQPIGQDGALEVDDENGSVRVLIERLHLEEDAAKNFHKNGSTLVDFNRGGTPLMEIVTKPVIRSSALAKRYLQELRRIMRHLDVSEADMEKGHLRCDANISLRPKGETKLYPKTEIKNLNSFRAVERALLYEVKRQTELWEQGTPVTALSTRGWDDAQGITVQHRWKEEAADYRYFPDPDLPPLHLDALEAAISLPEMPHAIRKRFQKEYFLSSADAYVLTDSHAWISYTEQVFSELLAWLEALPAKERRPQPLELGKTTGGWLTSKLLGLMREQGTSIEELLITPENFAEFIVLVVTQKVGSANAQKLLSLMLKTGAEPDHIMEEHEMGQVRDRGTLEAAAARVLASYPDEVSKYKNGKTALIKFFVGMVMKETGGTADPQLAEEILISRLQ